MQDLDIQKTAASRGQRWRNAGLLTAASLAATYLMVRVQTARTERQHPPRGRFVDVDGLRLHYIEQGDGPVLVLLHGNMVTAEDFRCSGLIERLAQSYRVIAIDRPGFGYSDRPRDVSWTPDAQAELLHQALRQLGAGEYLLLAHSWGTLVALAMALQQPARVQGLLLLSGYYYPGPRLDVPVAAMPAIPLLGDLMRYTVSPLIGRLIWPLTAKGMFSPSAVPQSFRREPPWMQLRPSQVRATASEAALMIPGAATLEGRYGELRLPVTIMAGEEDRVIDPHSHSERLQKTLPDSELVLLPDMGHMLPHLAQEEIVDAINEVAERAGLNVPARLDGAAPHHGEAAPPM
ncbi:alpha/beta fold hydrolase [Duganella radicis]|uniref:Alpha/beta fold hydrolase n=1 Tax=Duganella radicis TaxID=551988 RepID=A0A6L6PMS4_9BURK|nr:alpha/beta hydrolase [Duganella radicis]MTV39425.1 alpha/beta fold hydrolase [Duganella radicis]